MIKSIRLTSLASSSNLLPVSFLQTQENAVCRHYRCQTSIIPLQKIPPATVTPATRLLGTKHGVNNPRGEIFFYNEQDAIADIDEKSIRATIHKIMDYTSYPTYDVTVLLVDDDEMRETNYESRGINSPTDILSFPSHLSLKPGLLEEPEFDVPDYYTLGDIVICVPYVIRCCLEDTATQSVADDGDDEDFSDLFDGHDEDDDRGVSEAISRITTPEKRIRMLLVHGILHLVGYDHINDDDFEVMATKEEEILKHLADI